MKEKQGLGRGHAPLQTHSLTITKLYDLASLGILRVCHSYDHSKCETLSDPNYDTQHGISMLS